MKKQVVLEELVEAIENAKEKELILYIGRSHSDTWLDFNKHDINGVKRFFDEYFIGGVGMQVALYDTVFPSPFWTREDS